ncbi:YhdH/YhfP family quinone oxidoreductase [Thiorhodovibrio frisius]|uniref:Putative quinone oxidoreductase, YhdH/YhfP family n=1 Tax=Thiorhodovibrio frisius TaxID=631362 RepID=H8Z3L4_9GAMM|nr:YhdH/YhfP family quinone oxidoreductase [Thiorhodovibrio frisius]EIC20003.1 putative quinone oxidoreductase, YhdH/YhfP family [Thiorhodovibrio frisius]WPL20732.1 putative acrylyl-CoA reductase AcuI [Thiorhodovibrio frisius]
MRTARAFRIHHNADGHRAGVETLTIADPKPGEVLVRVHFSSINYKDALAGTGKGKILRQFPLIGGIDASGTVEVSAHSDFHPGDAVLTTGWGLSFDHDGGYCEYLCVPGDWLTMLPPGLDLAGSMTLGTAGLTAALAAHQMLLNGQEPAMGPILVTGASGGVGCIALALLAKLGFEVAAVSGKSELHPWLQSLGAGQILGRDQLPGGQRPLEKAVWGGAIDNVGGDMLGQITRTLAPNGSIASIGLAAGTELNTTVMPFILRGIKLLGCNSVDVSKVLRQQLWSRLAEDWRVDLEPIRTDTISLDALPATFERMLAGQTHGRVLVDLQAS